MLLFTCLALSGQAYIRMLLQQHDYSYSSSFICSTIPTPKLDLGAVYQLLTSGVGTLNGVFSCHQKLLHDLLSLQTGFFQPWDGFHVFLHVGSVASSYLMASCLATATEGGEGSIVSTTSCVHRVQVLRYSPILEVLMTSRAI